MHLIQDCVAHDKQRISKPWSDTPLFPNVKCKALVKGRCLFSPPDRAHLRPRSEWSSSLCLNVKVYHSNHIENFSFEKVVTFCHLYSWTLKVWGFSFELLVGHNWNFSSSINKGTEEFYSTIDNQHQDKKEIPALHLNLQDVTGRRTEDASGKLQLMDQICTHTACFCK